MDITKNFLESEIFSQEMYEDIVYFITSFHIRCGEFEGNRFIIKKMDQLNFFLYPEDIYEDGSREISYATSVYKNVLLKEVQSQAQKKGLTLLSLK